MALTSLNHYIDYEWMQYAYECTRKDGAVGVDGQTAEEYAANLEQNLRSLIDRLKSGRLPGAPSTPALYSQGRWWAAWLRHPLV